MKLKIIDVPLGQIICSTTNPRTYFDDVEIKALAEGILKYGLLHPITVRPIKHTPIEEEAGEAQRYEIISGERRYKAHELLKLESIQAIIKNATNEEAGDLQIVENLHRVNLNPLELSTSFNKLIANGDSVDEIATRMGKSKKYVYQYLMLHKLIQGAVSLLLNNQLPVTHAIRLAALNEKQQGKALKWLVSYPYGEAAAPVVKGLNELEDWLKNSLFLELKNVPWQLSDETLLPEVGSCVNCQKRTRAQSALFSEMVSEEDSCMDGKCFAKKRENYRVNKELAIVEAYGVKPVKIALNWEKGLPPDVEYAFSNKMISPEDKCSNCKPGMYINGANEGKECFVCIGCDREKEEPEAKQNITNEAKISTYVSLLSALHTSGTGTLKYAILALWKCISIGAAQFLADKWKWKTPELELHEMEKTILFHMEDPAPGLLEYMLQDITLMLLHEDGTPGIIDYAKEIGVKEDNKAYKELHDRLIIAVTVGGMENIKNPAELFIITKRKDLVEWLDAKGYPYSDTASHWQLCKTVFDFLK